jgi:hypothetical protein
MFILIGNGFHFNKILGHVMTSPFSPGDLLLPLPNLKQTPVHLVALTALLNPRIISAEEAENALNLQLPHLFTNHSFRP